MATVRMQIDFLEKELKRLKVEDNRLFPLLLNEIKDACQQVEQWHESPYAEGFAASTFEYVNRLAALVELLEVYDCGSSGGFGKDQPEDLDLKSRADWLLRKYSSKI